MSTEVRLRIARAGHEIAECSANEAKAGLLIGKYLPTDHYWISGMSEWGLLSDWKAEADIEAKVVAAKLEAERRRKADIAKLTARRLADQALADRERRAEAAETRRRMAPPSAASIKVDEHRHYVGMAGGTLVALSTITPFVSVAIFKITLLSINDNVRGWLLLILGVVSAVLALNKNFMGLRVSAVLTLLTVAELAFRLTSMAGPRSPSRSQLESNMEEVVRATVSADIGAICLIFGVLALLYAAFKKVD